MHELSALIKKDMVPALGVTEPGAISFCVAKAKSYSKGDLLHLILRPWMKREMQFVENSPNKIYCGYVKRL